MRRQYPARRTQARETGVRGDIQTAFEIRLERPVSSDEVTWLALLTDIRATAQRGRPVTGIEWLVIDGVPVPRPGTGAERFPRHGYGAIARVAEEVRDLDATELLLRARSAPPVKRAGPYGSLDLEADRIAQLRRAVARRGSRHTVGA